MLRRRLLRQHWLSRSCTNRSSIGWFGEGSFGASRLRRLGLRRARASSAARLLRRPWLWPPSLPASADAGLLRRAGSPVGSRPPRCAAALAAARSAAASLLCAAAGASAACFCSAAQPQARRSARSSSAQPDQRLISAADLRPLHVRLRASYSHVLPGELANFRNRFPRAIRSLSYPRAGEVWSTSASSGLFSSLIDWSPASQSSLHIESSPEVC